MVLSRPRDCVSLKPNCLNLSGYRLPTEAEAEYVTRAWATTSRFFGQTQDLLPKYARYLDNSLEFSWPVARLKPNDLGLFDVQGNARTWCQDRYQPDLSAVQSDDASAETTIEPTATRVLRGGAYNYWGPDVRSALRISFVPASKLNNGGFRPARTILPANSTAPSRSRRPDGNGAKCGPRRKKSLVHG